MQISRINRLKIVYLNDGCDHSLTFTREFLEKQKVDVEIVLDWIVNEGGGCDCEVLYNVEERFEE